MWIRKLSELSLADRQRAGGKAAQLGAMFGFNVPVPKGFVLTTDLFDEVILKSGLSSVIVHALSQLDENDTERLLDVSESLKAAIRNLSLGDAVIAEILSSFDALDVESVAVRSSAPEEDSEAHSWAGQFDTVLGVNRGTLIAAIKECWSSLFGVAALRYRRDSKSPVMPSIAVIIQEVVDSEISGVCFSADPVGGATDRMIIECVLGFGEGLVSGTLTPSRYSLENRTGMLMSRSEVSQSKAMTIDSRGEVSWCELSAPQTVQLADALLTELYSYVRHLETQFAHPVDVEWAVQRGRLFLLQARPITAKGIPGSSAGSSRRLESYEFYWAETRTIFTVESEFETYLHHRSVPANECEHAFCFVENGYATMYFCREDLPAAKREVERFLSEERQFSEYLESSRRTRERYFSLHDELLHRPPLQTSESQADFLKRFLEIYDQVRALYKLSQPAYTDVLAACLRAALLKGGVPKNELEQVFLVATRTTELDIVQEEEIAALELSLLDFVTTGHIRQHCEAFPWLFLGSFDRLMAEQFVTDKIQGLRRESIIEREVRLERIREDLTSGRMEREVLFLRLDNAEIRYLGEMLATLSVDRLRLKSCWAGVELLFFKFFSELAALAALDVEEFLNTYRREEMFKLVETGARLPDSIRAGRTNSYALHLSGGSYCWLEGEEARAAKASFVQPAVNSLPGQSLRGTIANLGHAIGRARVIRVEGLKTLMADMKRFQAGEIMVTTMTQPTMVALAKSAAAIVTNEGGVTSHASVIARELGIPCIVGTKHATEMIKDGDLVEVDAYRGYVRKLSGEEGLQGFPPGGESQSCPMD